MQLDSLLEDMMRSLEGKDLNWYYPSDLLKERPVRVYIRDGKVFYKKAEIEYRLIGVRWPTLKRLYNEQNGIDEQVVDPLEEIKSKRKKVAPVKKEQLSPDSIPFPLSASQKSSLNKILSFDNKGVVVAWISRYSKSDKAETILVSLKEVEEFKSMLEVLKSVKKEISSYNSLLSKVDIILQEFNSNN